MPVITTLQSYYHKTIKLATVLTQKRNFVNFCRFQAPTPVFVDTSQIKLYNYIIDYIKIFFRGGLTTDNNAIRIVLILRTIHIFPTHVLQE